jgi:DNA-directed RNA polymerase subunit RPC12/RpoP
MREEFLGSDGWVCARCNAPLAAAKAILNYLNRDFETDLMRCTSCGVGFVGEGLAMGKMLEVERSLEDK